MRSRSVRARSLRAALQPAHEGDQRRVRKFRPRGYLGDRRTREAGAGKLQRCESLLKHGASLGIVGTRTLQQGVWLQASTFSFR